MSVVISVVFYDVRDELVYSKEFLISNAIYVSVSEIGKFLKDHSSEFCYYTIDKVEVQE